MATFHHYSELARRVIYWARYDAIASHSDSIEAHHLLAGLFFQQPRLIRETLLSSSPPEGAFRSLAEQFCPIHQPYGILEPPLSSQSKQILVTTRNEALLMWKRMHSPVVRVGLSLTFQTWPIGVHHLLIGLAANGITQRVSETELSVEDLRRRLQAFREVADGKGIGSEGLANNAGRRLRDCLPPAAFEAARLGSEIVRPEELLLGMAATLPMKIQGLLGCTFDLRPSVQEWSWSQPIEKPASPTIRLAGLTKEILSTAAEESKTLGHSEVDVPHVLAGIIRNGQCFAARVLHKKGFGLNDAREFAREQYV